MTMAKKLPILSPSIHTFEMVGEYSDYEAKSHIFKSIKILVDEEKYRQVHCRGMPENYYIYKRIGGGLTIKLSSCPEYKKNYITLSGINLARIAGEPSRLTLTNLSPRGLDILEINTVIIPNQILNNRQYARFPVSPIYSRVQGIDR